MQAQLTPVVETAAPSAALRLPARLALLGILFAIEILLISYWLDTELLRGRGILATILHDWGAWFVRLGVAIALGSLIFAESRAKTDLKRISAECASSPIGWSIFAAHAASMLLFIWLSSAMFHATAGTFLNSQVLVWGCTGLLSFAMAACALIPVRVWVEIARSTGDAWIYGLGGAIVACAFGVLAQKLWIPLSHGTFNLVALMLRPFVAVLLVDPSNMSIGTPTFHVEISPECSGYEGMGLILAFSSAWLWFFRRQWCFPQALLLIPAGVALLWIANAVRIAALILIGNAGAPQIAIGGFHSEAGWIAFNAVAIGTCLLARRIPALVHDLPQSDTTNPTAPYLMPFLAILGAAMIAHALSAGFEWFYSLRIVAAAGALWYFRESYGDLNWRFGWIGAAAGALVFAIWMGFEKTFHSPAPAALMQASGAARIAWIASRIVGGVLIVPIAEELAFRGFLLRRLASPDFESVGWRTFSWAPFLISSIAFGIMHGERWLAGTIAGAIFALVQIRRGRIGDAIIAHSVANALVAAWVLGAGDWNLW